MTKKTMKLQEYLTKNTLTHSEFGALIDVNQSTISRLASGRSYPSPATAKKIYSKTRQRVDANSFYL